MLVSSAPTGLVWQPYFAFIIVRQDDLSSDLVSLGSVRTCTSSFSSVLSFPVVGHHKIASQAYRLIPVGWKTSNLNSDILKRPWASFLVTSVVFKIQSNASWSVRKVKWDTARYIRNRKRAHTKASHSPWVVWYAISALFSNQEQYLTCVAGPTGWYWSKTHPICFCMPLDLSCIVWSVPVKKAMVLTIIWIKAIIVITILFCRGCWIEMVDHSLASSSAVTRIRQGLGQTDGSGYKNQGRCSTMSHLSAASVHWGIRMLCRKLQVFPALCRDGGSKTFLRRRNISSA